MAINKNHEFEELDGVKCGIVEKNVLPERVSFLRELLELNGYTVLTVPSPPMKAAAAAKPVAPQPDATEVTQTSPTSDAAVREQKAPETFTVGVTDYTFNSINAVFGRMLKTKDGHIVSLAYWKQQEPQSLDEIPYFEAR